MQNMSKQPFLGGIEYERSETLDDKLDQGTGCWNFDRRTVPLSVMAAEKGWVNENGAVHFVDSNGSYAKNEWKTSQGVSYYLDGKAIWQRIPGSMELTMPGKMAA